MGRQRVESFVLRLVMKEPAEAGGEEAWVGRVQHVASGRELQFSGARELLAFINTVHAEHIACIERASKPQ